MVSSKLNRGERFSDVFLYGFILVFLALVVFMLPSNYKMMASLAFAAVVFLILCVQRPNKFASIRISAPLFFALVLFGIAILLLVILSDYSKSLLISYTAFLLLCFLLFYESLSLPNRSVVLERVFYITITLIILADVASHLGETSVMYLNGAYDKNYLGIIIYLYFAWCWATGRRLGVIVSIACALVIGSRNLVIMLVFFLAIAFVQAFRRRKRADDFKYQRNVSAPGVFLIFIAMFVGITVFSFWWSESMVGNSTTAYQMSMNDSSNAIRFNSDKYAIQYLLSNPQLVLVGYDGDIIDEMGIISNLNGTESALTGTFYNGYRIVQPHNVLLNMILKEGILYTVAYYLVLSFLLARYFKRGNLAYWLPFLFGCMFMHSLLTGYYLVFFLVVLSRSENNASLSTRLMEMLGADKNKEHFAGVKSMSGDTYVRQ